MTVKEAREALDSALYEYVKACGGDPDGHDYSWMNQEFDDFEEAILEANQ